MKPIFFLLTLTITLFFSSCAEELKQVSITTEYGEIVVELYNTTPKHRDNFLKLIDQAYYDGTLMHRVCLLYTSPSPRDRTRSRMPSSA